MSCTTQGKIVDPERNQTNSSFVPKTERHIDDAVQKMTLSPTGIEFQPRPQNSSLSKNTMRSSTTSMTPMPAVNCTCTGGILRNGMPEMTTQNCGVNLQKRSATTTMKAHFLEPPKPTREIHVLSGSHHPKADCKNALPRRSSITFLEPVPKLKFEKLHSPDGPGAVSMSPEPNFDEAVESSDQENAPQESCLRNRSLSFASSPVTRPLRSPAQRRRFVGSPARRSSSSSCATNVFDTVWPPPSYESEDTLYDVSNSDGSVDDVDDVNLLPTRLDQRMAEQGLPIVSNITPLVHSVITKTSVHNENMDPLEAFDPCAVWASETNELDDRTTPETLTPETPMTSRPRRGSRRRHSTFQYGNVSPYLGYTDSGSRIASSENLAAIKAEELAIAAETLLLHRDKHSGDELSGDDRYASSDMESDEDETPEPQRPSSLNCYGTFSPSLSFSRTMDRAAGSSTHAERHRSVKSSIVPVPNSNRRRMMSSSLCDRQAVSLPPSSFVQYLSVNGSSGPYASPLASLDRKHAS